MQQQQQQMSNKKNKQSTNVSTTIRQFRQIPSVMTCVFEHKTVESSADFEWRGPTLNDIWPEVLAFFRWTNDTMRSESQVRLFVNRVEQRWVAWAFPQRANGGMSAKELTETDAGYEKTIEQRAQFPDPDWYYWGTVHHHCNMSAFQSSVDQENERSQDGIHITVGNLNSPMYDLHARLYIDKFKLVFNLSDFWDIGEELETLPMHIARLLKPDAFDEMAKIQMCQPPPADQAFPEIWRTNVIDCTPKVVSQPVTNISGSSYKGTYDPGNPSLYLRPLTMRGKPNFESDLRRAASGLVAMLEHPQCSMQTIEDLINVLGTLCGFLDDEMIDIMDICSKHDVLPENMRDWLSKMKKQVEPGQEEQKQLKGPATQQEILGSNHGDYHGWEGMGG